MDVELQQLRRAALSNDPVERPRAVRELLRMDWRRGREAIMAVLEAGPWQERAVVLRVLASRADPAAREALPHVEAACPQYATGASRDAASPELQARALAEVAAVALRLDQPAHARGLCAQALEVAPQAPSLARVRAMHMHGAVLLREREVQKALGALREVVALYQAQSEPAYEARALDTMGSACANLFDLVEAERCYQRSLELKEQQGDLAGQAITLGGLGRVALMRGDLDEAVEFFTRDLRLSLQIGDDEGRAVMANQLGEALLRKALEARRRGDLTQFRAHLDLARQYVEDGVEPARRGGSLRDEGFSLMMLGRLELASERLDEADRLLARACDSFRVAHEAPALYAVELLRGEVARKRGDTGEARARVEAAIASYERLGSLDGQVRAWLELALVFHRTRDSEGGRRAIERAQELGRELPRSTTTSQLAAMRANTEVGRLLVEARLATQAQVDGVLDAILATGAGLGSALIRHQIVDREALGAFLASKVGIPTATAAELEGGEVELATTRLPRRAADRLGALPIALDGASHTLRVAMSDPLDFVARDQLSLMTGLTVAPLFAPDADGLRRSMRRAYGRLLGLERHPVADDALRALLGHAIARRASDLHLETKRDDVAVRARVDGALHDLDRLPRERGDALVRAVKSMAGLDLEQRALPQRGDARFTHGEAAREQSFDLRISTFPTAHGERVVIGVLSPAPTRTLAGIGLDDATASRLVSALGQRGGVLLVAGPTRSGRSTTLRALLSKVDAAARSVLTLDAPPERDAEDISQARAERAIGLDLPSALTALSTQDVDVVLVEELRDAETARIAANMAQSGAMILSTLHAFDAIAALTRLTQWGISSHQISFAVRGVVAQRLLPRLCSRCKVRSEERVDVAWLLERLPYEALSTRLENVTLSTRSASGCESCGFSGYEGQVAIFEYLPMIQGVAQGLREGLSESRLRETATREGFKGLADAALDRLLAGDVSFDALKRVL